jgi:hypothetical protein
MATSSTVRTSNPGSAMERADAHPDPAYHPAMNSDRLEALGPRGEACIILREEGTRHSGSIEVTFRLATGERLRVVEGENAFETLDGRRRYTLRNRRADLLPGT